MKSLFLIALTFTLYCGDLSSYCGHRCVPDLANCNNSHASLYDLREHRETVEMKYGYKI